MIRPPTTAASKIATPRGRVQCQPKNRKSVGAVFWVMKISNRIRITKPANSDDHSAPARVNPIAGSLVDAPVLSPWVGLGTAVRATQGWGCS